MCCIMAIVIYYIIYLDYGHWLSRGTAYKYTGDSVKVNASWVYRGKYLKPYFLH